MAAACQTRPASRSPPEPIVAIVLLLILYNSGTRCFSALKSLYLPLPSAFSYGCQDRELPLIVGFGGLVSHWAQSGLAICRWGYTSRSASRFHHFFPHQQIRCVEFGLILHGRNIASRGSLYFSHLCIFLRDDSYC